MRYGIAELLKKASEMKTDEERIAFLRQHNTVPLRTILQYAYDPNIKWLLPEGDVPYKPNEDIDQEGMLYVEARRLYLFIEGGNASLRQSRREMIFIQLLEALDKHDADLIVNAKDKKIPYKNITPALVRKAFPGLLPEEDVHDTLEDDIAVIVKEEVIPTVTTDKPKPVKKPPHSANRGRKWWTDGVKSKMAFESPGPTFWLKYGDKNGKDVQAS